MSEEWNTHNGGDCPCELSDRVIICNDNSDSIFAQNLEIDADMVTWRNVTRWRLAP